MKHLSQTHARHPQDQACERLALTSPYPAMETLELRGGATFTNRALELLPTIFPNLVDIRIEMLDAAVQGVW